MAYPDILAAPPMLRVLPTLVTLLLLAGPLPAQESASVRLADGFDLPVGQNGLKYYKARGYRPNGHLGEDWNGVGGGDSDLGDPVYVAGNGIVVFAEDYKLGWGNVVIVRHAYLEGGAVKYVDSLYGHLHELKTTLGAPVTRGQIIGTIGSNRGMYPAHLHFELRKDLRVGMHRSSFPRDFSVYWDPTQFIAMRRVLDHGGGKFVSVPVKTFAETPPPIFAETTLPDDAPPRVPGQLPSAIRRSTQQLPDKFHDLRTLGY
jgi:hypothetical protein